MPAGGLRPPSAEDEQQEQIAAGQGVIFCLEDAQLEVAQVGKVRAPASAEQSIRDTAAMAQLRSVSRRMLMPRLCAGIRAPKLR